jgi:exo-beta-1,3-glucanase (GH17 family)
VRWLALVLAVLAGRAGEARAISVDKLLGRGRLVAYSPRGFDPSVTQPPSARALRADADTLRAVGFRAVTTYGASRMLSPVCRVFKRRGFRTVLVGIRDPRDRAEIRRAVHLKRCADGYVVGNEGLTFGRYTREELDRAITRVRNATGRPVTTRETLKAYTDDPTLLRAGDWLFPTIHPWYAEHRDSQDACGYTIYAYRDLAAQAPAGIATVVAETGLPSEGAVSASEHYQRAFFLCIESRQVPFAHFEAFDQPWKTEDAVGSHWGLFRADGSPKLWATQQVQPAFTGERAGGHVSGRARSVLPGRFRVVAYVKNARWDVVASAVPDRSGAWQLDVPADRPVVVYLTWGSWTAPASLDQRPRVDRIQVLAERELPPP